MNRIAIALVGFAVAAAASEKKDVDIKAPDGLTLKGTYYSPASRGPAILLLHQCNMDRHAWDGLAQSLADHGFHVLTVDFRGYGESVNPTYSNPTQGRAVLREKWPGDSDAAFDFLMAQKGVDRSRVAAGGASCGVTQAADLADRHHQIKALVLLSGSASDAAKTYIASNPSLAIFAAASEGDASAAKGIKEAESASKNPQSMLKIYPGTEHGVPMFAKHDDLMPAIVAWLQQQLGGSTGSR